MVYIARFAEAVYVLHAFEKRTRKAPRRDVDLAQQNFCLLVSYRREAKG